MIIWMSKTNAIENEQHYAPYKSHVYAGLAFWSHHSRLTPLESRNIGGGGDMDLSTKDSGGNIRSQTNQVTGSNT